MVDQNLGHYGIRKSYAFLMPLDSVCVIQEIKERSFCKGQYMCQLLVVLPAFLHRDSVLFSFLHINKPWSWLAAWLLADESDENNGGGGGWEQVKLHVGVIYIQLRCSTNDINLTVLYTLVCLCLYIGRRKYGPFNDCKSYTLLSLSNRFRSLVFRGTRLYVALWSI